MCGQNFHDLDGTGGQGWWRCYPHNRAYQKVFYNADKEQKKNLSALRKQSPSEFNAVVIKAAETELRGDALKNLVGKFMEEFV